VRRVRGFTLVELLVVVAIICLLLSILTPSLARSKELVRRVICLSNMRVTIQACFSYAGAWRGSIPPSQAADGSLAAYSFDAKNSFTQPMQPMGVGLTVTAKYLSVEQLPTLLHCASLDTRAATVWNTPYHSMNVVYSNWWNGIGASWWSDPAFQTRRCVTSYNYRSASYWRTHNHIQLRSTTAATLALYLDVADPRFGGRYCHRDGHNCIRGDGSGRFVNILQTRIEAIVLDDGNPCTDGINDAGDDELVFALFEQ